MNFETSNEVVYANLIGNELAPELKGVAYFYPYNGGSLVEIEVMNLPKQSTHPYALHIHEGTSCGTGNFESSGGHFNPTNQPHPLHAGDLPPLFSNDGYSYMTVYTNRFTPKDVIGRTVIIHNGIDDFTTQPSGNSGPKMACGVITELKKN